MVKMTVSYQGDFHCELGHGPSGSRIETDAPKDNQGRGERFSPTDLVGAALASCIVTTMAIFARRDGVPFDGARAEVGKEMTPAPRRIGALPVRVTLPRSIPEHYRPKLEEIAHTCPVSRSLHPNVKVTVEIVYE
jgi:uncharacterized OsmC-like protein